MERFPLGPVLDFYGVQYVDAMPEQSIRCPVHDESRPSCSLNLDKAVFYCHACSAHGGALEIIEAREGLTGAPAHDFAAKLTGVRYEDLRREPAGFSGRRVPRGQGYRASFRRPSPARSRPGGSPWV